MTWDLYRGALLKLGIKVSKRTIQKYLPKERRVGSQTWATFLKNHAQDILACDFTVVHDLLFRTWHIFVIKELQTRRIIHAAVTASPTDEWTAQQLREATLWDIQPKYLIRDNDSKYGQRFSAASRGIEVLCTPIEEPKANALCERFIGSLRRECLDHMLILNWSHLVRIVQEYLDYFNSSRPHQGIDQQISNYFAESTPFPTSQPGTQIKATPVLGGLHHSYVWYNVSA